MTGAAQPASLGDLAAQIARVSDIYAKHYGIDRSGDWYMLKLQEEVGELTQAYLAVTGRSRKPADDQAKAHLAREMADVLGMLLLLARDEGIDLDQAVQDKWLSWLDRESAS